MKARVSANDLVTFVKEFSCQVLSLKAEKGVLPFMLGESRYPNKRIGRKIR
jgi:hypothetical protein